LSSLIGLLGIGFSLYFVLNHETGGFIGYLHPPAIILLGICPPCIMLLSHTISDFLTGAQLLSASLFSRVSKHQDEVIETLTIGSKLFRSEGLGAMVPLRNKVRYPLLRDGLSLIINDFKPEEIRHNLTARINAKQGQAQMAASLFENMSKICPGVGMIGTLIGLISMLSNMQDPSKIGSGMAMAMITTLYGLALGTIIYAPWGEKIALEAEKNLEIDLLVLEGVLYIKGRKSSVHLKDIMKTYGTKKTGNAKDHPKAALHKKGA
jgi:chemotaxis protein MotA